MVGGRQNFQGGVIWILSGKGLWSEAVSGIWMQAGSRVERLGKQRKEKDAREEYRECLTGARR